MYGALIAQYEKIMLGEEFTVDSMYRLCKDNEPELHWNKEYIYQILSHLKNAEFISRKVNSKVYQKLKEFPTDINLCDLTIIGRQVKYTKEHAN